MAKLLVFFAVLFALLAMAWMLLLPTLVMKWLRDRTGFEANVQSLMVNPFTGRIVARGVAINNPPTFPRAEFLLVREFEADAELFTLYSAKPVFDHIKLDIALVALVKRDDGRTNAEVFRDYLAPKRPGTGQEREQRPLQIRRLEVRFDRLLVADDTRRAPLVEEYPINLNRTFDNVTDTRQLMLPASLDQLFALGGAVGGLLPQELADAVDQALRSGTDVMRELGRRRPADFGGFTDTLEESKKP
jgi:hypothetical protein